MVTEKRETFIVEMAVLLSLLIHLLAFLTWQYRGVLMEIHWFRTVANAIQPARPPLPLKSVAPTITFVPAPTPPSSPSAPKPRLVEPPRTFVETDDSQPASATPKDARYYSNKSTAAANLNNPTGKDGDTPYLDGKDTRMVSTENVAPSAGTPSTPVAPPTPPRPPTPPSPPSHPTPPSQPAASPTPKPVPPKPEEPPKKPAPEGLKMVEEKPPAPPNQMAMLERPAAPALPVPPSPPPSPAQPAVQPSMSGMGSHREISTLKSHLSASGTQRIGTSAFNVAGSPFGDYDKTLAVAIQSRWLALVEKNGLYERAGTVTVKFYIQGDGTLKTDDTGKPRLETKDDGAGMVLASFCEKAVLDSAPFAPFTEQLKALMGADAREIDFIFYY